MYKEITIAVFVATFIMAEQIDAMVNHFNGTIGKERLGIIDRIFRASLVSLVWPLFFLGMVMFSFGGGRGHDDRNK